MAFCSFLSHKRSDLQTGIPAADRSEMLRGARLQIEPVHAVTLCDACGKTYDTVPQGRTCPYCGSGDTRLLQGNACSIREIEAR